MSQSGRLSRPPVALGAAAVFFVNFVSFVFFVATPPVIPLRDFRTLATLDSAQSAFRTPHVRGGVAPPEGAPYVRVNDAWRPPWTDATS